MTRTSDGLRTTIELCATRPGCRIERIRDARRLPLQCCASRSGPRTSRSRCACCPAGPAQHLAAIYDVARVVDDLGDRAAGDRTRTCSAFRDDLERVWTTGQPVLPGAARPGADGPAVPSGRRRRSSTSSRPTCRTSGSATYETFEDLLGYCRLSADPVGRLVLAVFGVDRPAYRPALRPGLHGAAAAGVLAGRRRGPQGRPGLPAGREHAGARRRRRPTWTRRAPRRRCAGCSPTRPGGQSRCWTAVLSCSALLHRLGPHRRRRLRGRWPGHRKGLAAGRLRRPRDDASAAAHRHRGVRAGAARRGGQVTTDVREAYADLRTHHPGRGPQLLLRHKASATGQAGGASARCTRWPGASTTSATATCRCPTRSPPSPPYGRRCARPGSADPVMTAVHDAARSLPDRARGVRRAGGRRRDGRARPALRHLRRAGHLLHLRRRHDRPAVPRHLRRQRPDRRPAPTPTSSASRLQQTNILRDVREDLLLGRVYLPREDLDRFGVTLRLDSDRRLDDCGGALDKLIRSAARAGRAATTTTVCGCCRCSTGGVPPAVLQWRASTATCSSGWPRRPQLSYDRRMSLSGWQKARVAVRAMTGRAA